ncbi:hypothetical protein ANN_04311 [Periplaneta americana]|uniref:DUF659 domain-containing protein n=1 Tax=Periplaneta americana TaxID=6978 RepID=A0ABQ8T879_PERAM|nr:hypothetical protein ANN_04311 [Periplaneta americana]
MRKEHNALSTFTNDDNIEQVRVMIRTNQRVTIDEVASHIRNGELLVITMYLPKRMRVLDEKQKYYLDVLNQIRKAVGNNKIWVSVDETTDETGRFVAHVVLGTLSPDGPGEKFLLTAEVLDKVNHASIVTLFENSMSLLWPDGVKHENILLLVTDGAAYMMKAGRQIKLSYLTSVT